MFSKKHIMLTNYTDYVNMQTTISRKEVFPWLINRLPSGPLLPHPECYVTAEPGKIPKPPLAVP